MAKKSPAELYEEAERAAIGDAIAETEQEIFDEALDLSPDDNTGDRSLEEMDGEDVLDDDDVEGEDEETGEAEGEEGEGEEPPQTRHDGADRRDGRRGVPPGRLREEAEGRRVAEAEARELRARIEAIERGQQRQPQQQEPPPEPDMFADPEGWANNLRNGMARQFEERRINASMGEAEEEHGDAFREAFQALQGSGNPQLVGAILNANNPGRELMRWHDRAAAMREIGGDPVAYRQRLREELLQDPEVRRDGGQPRTRTQLPPSLNGATGGTSHRGGNASRGTGGRSTRSVEEEIAASAWED
jgi:hypothetical protein